MVVAAAECRDGREPAQSCFERDPHKRDLLLSFCANIAIMIYDQLRRARLAKGLTLEELSRQTGIAQPNLSRLERGRVDSRLSTLTTVAEALDLSIAFAPRAVTTIADVRARMTEGATRLAERGIVDRNAARRLEWKRRRGVTTDVEESALR